MTKRVQQMMRLVSSWSHYLDFQCNDCGESVHVDAELELSDAVACRSDKCRTPTQRREAVATGERLVLIGMPAGPRKVWQPSPA